MRKPFTGFHIMRTYGNYGGENQLARMFAQPAPEVREHFVFLYRDAACEKLFSNTKLHFHRLVPFNIAPRRSAWGEMLLLLPFLPWMQLRLLLLLLWHRPGACVVHGFQAALAAWPAAMLMKRRTGFAYMHRIAKSAAGRHPLFCLIYAPYRKLLGVSQAVKSSLAGFADASRLGAIENGVDIRIPSGKRHAPTAILCVGRLLPHKGQKLIIEAFALCKRSFPEIELWIAGDGECRAELEAAAGESVRFLGRRDDIPALLASASIFCHASDWEGMSNAVLEAMAAGLPSVVADAPGVSECHINDVTGFVVERAAIALAEKLLVLLNNTPLQKRMGEAAAAHVREHYSIQANRQKYLRLYHELSGAAPCAESSAA